MNMDKDKADFLTHPGFMAHTFNRIGNTRLNMIDHYSGLIVEIGKLQKVALLIADTEADDLVQKPVAWNGEHIKPQYIREVAERIQELANNLIDDYSEKHEALKRSAEIEDAIRYLRQEVKKEGSYNHEQQRRN